MHPKLHGINFPQRPAHIVEPSGGLVTFKTLNERSNQIAHLFRSLGIRRGDVISILMANNTWFFVATWAADRAGLYYTCLSTHASPSEAAYIMQDSDSKLLLASHDTMPLAINVAGLTPGIEFYMVEGAPDPFKSLEAACENFPVSEIGDESSGSPMLYSSGTTGKPKGVKFPLPDLSLDEIDPLTKIAIEDFGFNSDMVLLTAAPLYHTMPLRWSMCAEKLGGTVIIMEKFDPEAALQLIEKYNVTHSQWVPTHFVRMLKLEPEIRAKYDLSSMQLAYHAAAPCPVPVKQAMMDWWGPIIHEFYSGTEFNGVTSISPRAWLARPGSVGKATFGVIHIVGEAAEVLPPGKDGMIYFSGGSPFAYHKDPTKTAEAYNSEGWSTIGDIGRVDEEGYLYLTDRKSFMIISGGVNIYPQEIENLIVTHPKVADVAVIGAPDEDKGEQVVAVVQPLHWEDAGPQLAAEITAFVKANLSSLKVPRRVDFSQTLPRLPTGKLYKRILRDQYWKHHK